MSSPKLPSDDKITFAHEQMRDLRKRFIAAGFSDGDIVGVMLNEAAAMLWAGLGPERAVQFISEYFTNYAAQGGPKKKH
jgi:hypothetical protein